MPYRTKIDCGADGILGAGTTPLLRAAKTGDATYPLAATNRANPSLRSRTIHVRPE